MAAPLPAAEISPEQRSPPPRIWGDWAMAAAATLVGIGNHDAIVPSHASSSASGHASRRQPLLIPMAEARTGCETGPEPELVWAGYM